MYEIDVHYYLTYWLASKIPCYSSADAQQIANADQGADENPNTKPGLGATTAQQNQNAVNHALTDSATILNNGAVLWGNATESPAIDTTTMTLTGRRRNCELSALGIYLHYLQDTFSHDGYSSDVYGHLLAGHSVDKTANDYAKAAKMAAATWNALIQWTQICKSCCYSQKVAGQNLFVTPMGQQLTDFLRASGGPFNREISQSEIDAKRAIIGGEPRPPIP